MNSFRIIRNIILVIILAFYSYLLVCYFTKNYTLILPTWFHSYGGIYEGYTTTENSDYKLFFDTLEKAGKSLNTPNELTYKNFNDIVKNTLAKNKKSMDVLQKINDLLYVSKTTLSKDDKKILDAFVNDTKTEVANISKKTLDISNNNNTTTTLPLTENTKNTLNTLGTIISNNMNDVSGSLPSSSSSPVLSRVSAPSFEATMNKLTQSPDEINKTNIAEIDSIKNIITANIQVADGKITGDVLNTNNANKLNGSIAIFGDTISGSLF